MEKKKFRCYRCDALVGEKDKVCPNCGLDFDSDEPVVMERVNVDRDSIEAYLNGCKVVAIIFAVVGFIAGLIVWASTYSPSLAFSIWAGVFVAVVFMYGFGEIIDNTKATKDYAKKIYELLSKNTKSKKTGK